MTMRRVALALLAVALLWGNAGDGGAAERPTSRYEPHIGYAYPAGGQIGTRFRVKVGGQYLRNVLYAHVSGEGVTAAIDTYVPPARNLDAPVRRLLLNTLVDLIQRKRGVVTGARAPRPKQAAKEGEEEVTLPEHPLLEDLEKKSFEELNEIARYFFVRIDPLQSKRSIAESVYLTVTVARDAEPGPREIRIETKQGLSNPIEFRIGAVPEVVEFEPFRPNWAREDVYDLPVVVNGQILPRDVDRYRFRAQAGQRLVLRAEARSLVPFQADSVPGWMQAVLTVYDTEGREVAYADEFRYDPDPVLFFDVPADGEYVLEVADAISRGRDDFVYRVEIGELPFVSRIFPLGGRRGALTFATVDGRNLDLRRLPLDTGQDAPGVCEVVLPHGKGVTNPVRYAVDELPEMLEAESGEGDAPRPVELPIIVNGRIDHPDDVDAFTFEGRSGRRVAVEVTARVLGSPLDSVIRLLDEKGEVVAWNDDHVPEGLTVRGLGLQTHHADSHLLARLPRSGTYTVTITDVTAHGSADHAYRLRISEPRPDVDLYVTPSSVNVPAGRASMIAIHAIKKDGFDEDVEVELVDPPDGIELVGGYLPAGKDKVWMTLTAPGHGLARPVSLRLVGRAKVGREEIVRTVRPADDVMQAFLWRHIVPASELLVAVQGSGRWIPRVTLHDEEPVRLPQGRSAKVRFDVQGRVPVQQLRFELIGPPKGISVGEVKTKGQGFTIELEADRDVERTGRVENLIVEAFAERPVRKKDAKGKARNAGSRRYSLGLLPAIPYIVVRR